MVRRRSGWIQGREAAGRRGMPTFCCWFAAANQQQQPQPQKVSVPTPQEQQPMESVSNPQPPIEPQQRPQKQRQPQKKVSVTPQTQQQQQRFQQKVSVSPPQAQAQAQQQYKVSDAPPNTEPQPQQQSETQENPSVREKGTIPSGVVNHPTPEEDAAIRRRAFTGRGCDVGLLLHVLTKRDATHRHLIQQHYKKNYGEELSDRISSGLSSEKAPLPTPEDYAATLHRAFKGKGYDVGKVVQFLAQRDSTHRNQIAQLYKKNYDEELSDRISSEFSGMGDLKEQVGVDLTVNPTGACSYIKRAISLWLLEESERDATIVWLSLQPTSFDKAALTEVICSRTPSQLRSLKQAYFTKYGSRLLEDISASTFRFYGYHKELLIACLDDKTARDEGTNVDPKMAEEDAKQLYKDGENMWGTNEKTFVEIFTKRNRPHLAAIDVVYERLYGHSLEEAVKKETSGYFEAGLLTLLRCAKNSAKYFAEVLYNSMKGLGTSDTTLMRVVVTRDGIDMEDIKKEYVQAYKISLLDAIHKDTSGHYRTFLLNATGTLSRIFSSDVMKGAVSLWMLEESERDAAIVRQALQVTSFDKAAVTEVICSRTPSQLCNIQRAYRTKFSSQLLQEINSSDVRINSHHKELLIACLDDQARDEGTNVDLKMAEEDAIKLYGDGEKIWGTNEKTFIDIFTKRNRPHLVAVDAAYHRLYGHSLEEAVEKETSRSFKDGLLTLLRCAKNPAKYFAEVLYNAMKGVGTSDTTLIRTVVTRAGIDMEDVKKEYAQAYKKSLKDAIHKDTSGDYRTFLISLVE